MKKLFYTFTLLLIANFTFSSCSKDDATDPSVTDAGVTIAGIRWATRNVAVPGTFTDASEHAGAFYQWNRQQGVANWGTDITGTAWESVNDPCPPGWRVPTAEEFTRLRMVAGSRWTIQNGVAGYLFGGGNNQIFLPAANGHAIVFESGATGLYWSSTQSDAANAQALVFNRSGSGATTNFPRTFGLSVRCVAK